MRLFVFFIKFVFLAAFFIVSSGDLHLGVEDERNQFYDEYQAWVLGVVGNVGELTGYVIEVEWLPEPDGISAEPDGQKTPKK